MNVTNNGPVAGVELGGLANGADGTSSPLPLLSETGLINAQAAQGLPAGEDDDVPKLSQGAQEALKDVLEALCLQAREKLVRKCIWLSPYEEQLEASLQELVQRLQPTAQDEAVRADVLERVNQLVQGQGLLDYEGSRLSVQPYGSYVSKMYTPNGDLDIALEGELVFKGSDEAGVPVGSLDSEEKVQLLKELCRKLDRKRLIRGRCERILHARVPIIKFQERVTGLPCDMAVGSTHARFKSEVLRHLCSLDPRFSALYRVVKAWAANNRLNDSASGTFNSLALSLMVIFHLQTRQPAILPPLCELFGSTPGETARRPLRGTPEADDSFMQECKRRVGQMKGYGEGNKETLLHLFASFLAEWNAIIQTWTNRRDMRSVRASAWAGGFRRGVWHKNYAIGVEDPFDVADNCARTIAFSALPRIGRCFAHAASALSLLRGASDTKYIMETLLGQRPDGAEERPSGPDGEWRRSPGNQAGAAARPQRRAALPELPAPRQQLLATPQQQFPGKPQHQQQQEAAASPEEVHMPGAGRHQGLLYHHHGPASGPYPGPVLAGAAPHGGLPSAHGPPGAPTPDREAGGLTGAAGRAGPPGFGPSPQRQHSPAPGPGHWAAAPPAGQHHRGGGAPQHLLQHQQAHGMPRPTRFVHGGMLGLSRGFPVAPHAVFGPLVSGPTAGPLPPDSSLAPGQQRLAHHPGSSDRAPTAAPPQGSPASSPPILAHAHSQALAQQAARACPPDAGVLDAPRQGWDPEGRQPQDPAPGHSLQSSLHAGMAHARSAVDRGPQHQPPVRQQREQLSSHGARQQPQQQESWSPWKGSSVAAPTALHELQERQQLGAPPDGFGRHEAPVHPEMQPVGEAPQHAGAQPAQHQPVTAALVAASPVLADPEDDCASPAADAADADPAAAECAAAAQAPLDATAGPKPARAARQGRRRSYEQRTEQGPKVLVVPRKQYQPDAEGGAADGPTTPQARRNSLAQTLTHERRLEARKPGRAKAPAAPDGLEGALNDNESPARSSAPDTVAASRQDGSARMRRRNRRRGSREGKAESANGRRGGAAPVSVPG